MIVASTLIVSPFSSILLLKLSVFLLKSFFVNLNITQIKNRKISAPISIKIKKNLANQKGHPKNEYIRANKEKLKQKNYSKILFF